jgi:ABC-2 type transport system ATP-binding protein
MTTSTNHQPAIETVHLSKRFKQTLALNDLCLKIPRGSTFGLLGPNGAGKSTTIKILLGILPATAGEARVLGIDSRVDPTRIKQLVGYVPESHHIYRWMRVGEVLGFCRSCYVSWNSKTCQEMLQRFELDTDKKIKHLSKGMLVKLALLLVLCQA